MGAVCCESRYKYDFLTTGGSSFSGDDIKAIEEIYLLASFPGESTSKIDFTYQEMLNALSITIEDMQSTNKLPKRVLLDWVGVSTILSERAKEDPEKRYIINRDAFFQLWEIADNER